MPDTDEATAEITVEINGKDFILKPTLEACIEISRIAGGLNAAVGRLAGLDFDTICEVLKFGIGLNPNQAKLLQQEVYQNGLIYLYGPCIDFVHIVANGGRPIPPPDETEDMQTGESPLGKSA